MKTSNFPKSGTLPDYVKERDVFGQVKSKRTSMIFDSSGYRGTPGKRFLKLNVVDLYGKKLSIVSAMFRCLSVFISIAPLGLGIWYISTDPKKQGWHDLIAGSYVIKS